ncbi:MAG: hypothetical protein Q8Q94_03400 [bacterium]|nr:hypothetical protein [bacterium]MDZ4299741.1 hypothetical protein [Candidatus Sungbacteria bacterium]
MNRQNLILIAGVIILGVGFYFWFQGSPFAGPAGSTSTSREPNQFEAYLQTVRPLATINFDISIFQDPSFRSLRVPTIPPLPDTPAGRPNPFLPI